MHQIICIMKGEKLILWVTRFLHWGWMVNLILAGGIVGFQVLNLIKPQKDLSMAYLGKFRMEINKVGTIERDANRAGIFYLSESPAQPSIVVDNGWHPYFVLLFSLTICGITLFYNYQFKMFFFKINKTVKEGTPFHGGAVLHLNRTIWFSMLVFAAGSVLSAIKVVFLPAISFDGFVAHPVYDNSLLNFFWFALGMYVISQIYQVGLGLKQEQDLTI